MPNKNTIMFYIGASTVLKLDIDIIEQVYSIIEQIVNGDDLYENPSKETILEAYASQENPFNDRTWSELIGEIMAEHPVNMKLGI
jgi:hypothetical protein